MKIEKMTIKYNYSTRRDKIKYIVIHTTGNTKKGAGINNHFNYFNGGNRDASADYFVENERVAQFVNDNNKSWHCGDGGGRYGITNDNSVGIEICVNSDADYKKTLLTTLELVRYLMKKYNIPQNRVVQHYDASRKNCPAELRAGKDGYTWKWFVNELRDGATNHEPTPPKPTNKKLWELCVSGQTVKDLQKAIKVKQDGYFGEDTLKACPLIKKGSKGDVVKAAQKRLNELKYSTNGIDGIFGDGTYNAVVKFQKAKKLSADGIVGNNTWKALFLK